MGSSTCEVTLELARSEDIESPFSFRFAPQEYLLRHDDGRYRRSTFPWDARVLGALAELERPEPDAGAVPRLGEALRAFLTPLDWRLHEDRLERALKAGQEVHITLRFAAAELYSLPWELVTLESSGQHLGELAGCTLRYEWPGAQGEAVARPPPPPSRGRLLFAWSSAGGPVPVAQHLRALLEACRRRGFPFDAVADVVENVSTQSLAQALAERPGEPVSVLHVLCHGTRKGEEAAGLLWNPSQGNAPELVDAGRLRQMLAPYAGTLRLVVLCACQGGDSKPGNHLGSVAQALHRAGIPAVVASRLPMSTRASALLAETLHAELMRGSSSSVERALAAARSRLRREVPGLDWASLQLYATPEGAGSIPYVLQPPRRPRRRLALAAAGVVALLALVGVGLFVGGGDRSTPVESPPPIALEDEKLTAALRAVEELREKDPTLALLILRELPPAQAGPDWLELADSLLRVPVSQVVFKVEGDLLASAAFSPDGRKVVTGSKKGSVRVWPSDGSGEAVVLREPVGDGQIMSVAFSPEGDRVVAGIGRAVRIWRADGGGEPIVLEERGEVRFVQFSPDGTRVFTISSDGVRIWPASGQGKPLVLLENGDRFVAAFSRNGERVAIASELGAVEVRSTDGQGEPVTLQVRVTGRGVNAVALSPDGKRGVAVSRDGAEVWQADGQGDRLWLEPIGSSQGRVTFSSDGSRIAAVGRLGQVSVWRTDAPGDPLLLKGNRYSISSIAFGAGGRRLLASYGRVARLWTLGSRAAPLEFRGHVAVLMDEVVSADFSPDERRVLTLSLAEGSVRLWSVPLPEEAGAQALTAEAALDQLRRATRLCLEPAQRRQYLGEALETARARSEACLHAP